MLEVIYRTEEATAVLMVALRLAIFDGRRAGETRDHHALYRFSCAEHPEDPIAFCEELESALHMADVRDRRFRESVSEQWHLINSRATRKKGGSLQARRLAAFRKQFPSERDVPGWEAVSAEETGELTEKMLEDWLYENGNALEPGLVFTERQFHLVEGRVDLIGRDAHGVRVLCEVKVCSDDRVLWQGLNYPALYRKEIFPEDVRMIVVGPEQKASTERRLGESGVERYLYAKRPIRVFRRPSDI